jgi:hypothetical protein
VVSGAGSVACGGCRRADSRRSARRRRSRLIEEAEQFLATPERRRHPARPAPQIRLDRRCVRAPLVGRATRSTAGNCERRPVELAVELCGKLLDRLVYPTFGVVPLCRFTSASVRTWHAGMRQRGVRAGVDGEGVPATKGEPQHAVEDDLTPRNPCKLKAAGVKRSPERTPPPAEVDAIASCIEPRYELRGAAPMVYVDVRLRPEVDARHSCGQQRRRVGCPEDQQASQPRRR